MADEPAQIEPAFQFQGQVENLDDGDSTTGRAPNDEKQIEGFDVTHHFMLLLMNNHLFGAPVEGKNLKILDVGTGTGIWAMYVLHIMPIRFVKENEDFHVIGIDISPIQPGWVPPNCQFFIDDAQLDWTFKPDEFDFVHARGLFGGIDNWQKLYDQAFRHLKPGGWFESIEADSQVRSQNDEIEKDPKHVFKQWAPLFWQAGDIIGKTFRVAQDDVQNPIIMETCMRRAGFVDIVHKKWRVPVGPWAKDPYWKEVGEYAGLYVDQGLEGWALRPLSEILGWTYEELLVFIDGMRKELRNKSAMPYFNYHMVYGRKPEA
ncbi:SAM dependent methyltransferase [Colletotrichum camelliae]|nr:SAM dependent methyltransferase [Colletotrichum camelliae]